MSLSPLVARWASAALLGATAACSLATRPGDYSAYDEPGAAAVAFLLLGGRRDGAAVESVATVFSVWVDGTGAPLRVDAEYPLPDARVASAARVGDRLLVFDPGAENRSSSLMTSSWGGSVEPWQRRAVARGGHPRSTSVTTDKAVLLLGGGGGSSAEAGVFALTITEGTAELGPWRAASVSLLRPRWDASALVWQGVVYVVGGLEPPESNPKGVVDVELAVLDEDGIPGAFAAAPSLPIPLVDAALAAGDGFFYVVGGAPGGLERSYFDSVFVSAIDPKTKGLGAWRATTALPFPLTDAAAVVRGRRIYVAGGARGSNVERSSVILTAPIEADGSLGAWSTAEKAKLPEGYEGLVVLPM